MVAASRGNQGLVSFVVFAAVVVLALGGKAGLAQAQSSSARPAKLNQATAAARVSQVLPEGCVALRAVRGRIKANGDTPSQENERRASEALAREASRIGGNLVVPSGLGHSLESVTRYGHAFRCDAPALASLGGRPRCKVGALALAPTEQELRWGTKPAAIDRLSDCSLRRVYAIGKKAPKLGVPEYHEYPSEDCDPADVKGGQAGASCAQKLAPTRRVRSDAQSAGYALLAHAIRVKEATRAASVSAEAFAKLAAAFGKDSRELAEARAKYPVARQRCQRDGACSTFGDESPVRGAVDVDSEAREIDRLRDQGRYADAAMLAVNYARRGVGRDPGLTTASYTWRAARILLLDLGEVRGARDSLEHVGKTLGKLREAEQQGVGASFGFAHFPVPESTLANAYRTLALARLADGDRPAALEAYGKACQAGGCALAQPALPHSLAKEQALLELALGRCTEASARLEALARAAAQLPERDARWADASLEALTASFVCGNAKDPEASIRGLLIEDARLNGLNAGESGASAGEALGRRLTYLLVSWALAKPDELKRRELALDAVLAFKGNLLAQQRDALRRAKAAEVRALNDQLGTTYASLARAGQDAVIAEATNPSARYEWDDHPWRLRMRADAVERERARLAGVDSKATLDLGKRLAQSLTAGQPLIEYFRYRPYDFAPNQQARRWGADRYAAFVVQRGAALELVDLGPAVPIDRLSDDLLNVIQACPTCPRRGLVLSQNTSNASANPARDLFQALLAPLSRLLGTARDVYIAADSALWRIPFAALEDASGTPLLDQGYVFRYLPASQELTRPLPTSTSKSLLAFGAPEYGAAVPGSLLSNFRPLPNTMAEAEAIARLWRASGLAKVEVQLRLGEQASKEALLGASTFGIVHVATHGWFLPSSLARPRDTQLFLTPEPVAVAPPMVRTGLALSGANLSLDGVVTALELSTLDLRSTQLVVLSACETGRGEVRSGEGVFGLSRAFLSNGAETVISSLWSVDDAATRDLMVSYYTRLLRGEDRVTSLYRAARELRQTPGYEHPWYWAGFLAYGRGGRLRL